MPDVPRRSKRVPKPEVRSSGKLWLLKTEGLLPRIGCSTQTLADRHIRAIDIYSMPRTATAVSAIQNRWFRLIIRALKQAGKRGYLQHGIQCRQGEDPTIRIPDDRAECIIDPGPADAT